MRPMICMLVILLLVGCISQEPSDSAIQTAIAQTQTAQQSSEYQPNLPPVQITPSIPDTTPRHEDSQLDVSCNQSQFKIIPVNIFQHPIGNGWKILIVELMLVNESPYWTNVYLKPSNASVTTEDGYTYPAWDGGELSIPNDSISPYSGWSEQGIGVGTVGGGIWLKNLAYIPPSFAITGITSGDNADINPFSLAFEVAENQHQFVITIDQVGISCYFSGGQEQQSLTAHFSIDLRNGSGMISTLLATSQDIPNVPAQFDMPDQGIFSLLRVTRSPRERDEGVDDVTLRFKFKNTTGYNQDGELDVFVIGDNGRISLRGSGRYMAGPGQETQVDLRYPILKDVGTLIMVWKGGEDHPPFEVYKLPLPITASSDDEHWITFEYQLLGYDLAKVKTENGMTTYQVGVAMQNISDHVVVPTIRATGAQVTTEDGGIFPAQFVRRAQHDRESWDAIVESHTYDFMGPCATIVDEVDITHNQTTSYAFVFEIQENLIPATLKVPGFFEIQLNQVNRSDQLRFDQTCPESKLPLAFTTDKNIRVTISNARKILNEQEEPVLAINIDLENLNSAKEQKIRIFWSVIDPEGSRMWAFGTCDNAERCGNLGYGQNTLKPGQMVNGEITITLKPDSYYVWPIWEKVDEIHIPESQDLDGTITVEGIDTTFEELRNGIELADGRKLVWYGNKRTRLIEIFESKGVVSRVRRNLGDVYYLTIIVDDHQAWATIPLP
jgi:hypothetical protein